MFSRAMKFIQLAFIPTAFYGAGGMLSFAIAFSLGASVPAHVVGLIALFGLTLTLFCCFQPFWALSKKPTMRSTPAQMAGLAIAFVIACLSYFALGRGVSTGTVDLVAVIISLVAWIASLAYFRLIAEGARE